MYTLFFREICAPITNFVFLDLILARGIDLLSNLKLKIFSVFIRLNTSAAKNKINVDRTMFKNKNYWIIG